MTAKRREGPRRDFFALADVRSQLVEALRFYGDRAETELRETIDDHFAEQRNESPIEAVFAIWWLALNTTWGAFDDLQLMPQERVTLGEATYRLDFTVGFPDADLLRDAHKFGLSVPAIAVELDGHDFHERTREQVELRNRRDRDLQSAGWKVFHFSGAEVMRDPKRCVEEVRHYASAAQQRLWGQCYERKQAERP